MQKIIIKKVKYFTLIFAIIVVVIPIITIALPYIYHRILISKITIGDSRKKVEKIMGIPIGKESWETENNQGYGLSYNCYTLIDSLFSLKKYNKTHKQFIFDFSKNGILLCIEEESFFNENTIYIKGDIFKDASDD